MPKARNHYKRWSSDDSNELYELLKQGKSFKQIGAKLGRTETAIVCKIKRDKI